MTPPTAPPSVDPASVQAARRGEPEGLRAVCAQAYPLVRRWVAAGGARADEVDDATQDVMVLVLRKIATFRGESRFSTWLYQVTRRAMLDRVKSRTRRERPLQDLEAAHDLSARHADPEEEVDRSRAMGRVRRAFESLPPRQREVFDLADLQGFAGPEIATMLGLAPSSVRVSLLKARRAIRAELVTAHPEPAKESNDEL